MVNILLLERKVGFSLLLLDDDDELLFVDELEDDAYDSNSINSDEDGLKPSTPYKMMQIRGGIGSSLKIDYDSTQLDKACQRAQKTTSYRH